MGGVAVGSVWREHDRNKLGRVIVVTSVDIRYVFARAEAPPHRRTRIELARLTRCFTEIGQMDMAQPEHWPAYFAEDANPQGTEVK